MSGFRLPESELAVSGSIEGKLIELDDLKPDTRRLVTRPSHLTLPLPSAQGHMYQSTIYRLTGSLIEGDYLHQSSIT